jgi:hypothetical protein
LTDHLGEHCSVHKGHNAGHAKPIIKKNVTAYAVEGTAPFM